MAVREVANGVFLIDVFDMGIPNKTAVYLVRDEKCVLIETGPARSKKHILDGLREIGIKKDDLHFIVLTHIHIDHAGGVGWLLEDFPHTFVVVHPKGGPHLINPENLRASTKKVRSNYPFHPCDFLPVAAEKIIMGKDGQKLYLGRRTLTLIETPGHASHCLCIHDDLTNGIFVGDSLGLKIDYFIDGEKYEMTFPAMVLPRFDPQKALASTEKLIRFGPEVLYYTHFGSTKDVTRLMEKYRSAVQRVMEIAENLKSSKVDCESAFAQIYSWAVKEILEEIPEDKFKKIAGEMKISLELNTRGLLGYIFNK